MNMSNARNVLKAPIPNLVLLFDNLGKPVMSTAAVSFLVGMSIYFVAGSVLIPLLVTTGVLLVLGWLLGLISPLTDKASQKCESIWAMYWYCGLALLLGIVGAPFI